MGMILVASRVSSNCREQKKLPPKMVCGGPALPFLPNRLVIVYAIVVLPEPAWPVSQNTRGLCDEQFLAQFVMSSNILTRVPVVHSSRFRARSPTTVL